MTTISPEQINAKQHLWDAFGKMETEVSAGWIVLFCQQRGQGWKPFTRAEIEVFYHEQGRQEDFWFNGLLREDQRFLRVQGVTGEETYEVTPEFIEQCYHAAPQQI